MEEPRIGDTFLSTCPAHAVDRPVLHVVRRIANHNGKVIFDVIGTHFPAAIHVSGSYNVTEQCYQLAWLRYQLEGAPEHLKTEKVDRFTYRADWAERLSSNITLGEEERKQVSELIENLLQKKKFCRKSDLEFELAKQLPKLAELNMAHANQLRVSFPHLAGIVKNLRFENRIDFGMQNGQHVYGRGKVVQRNSKASLQLAEKLLRDFKIQPGPIGVSIWFYIPLADQEAIDHFFQQLLPRAEIRHRLGSTLFEVTKGGKTRRISNFQVDETPCHFEVSDYMLTIKSRLQERCLNRALMKLALIGQGIARELTCMGKLGQKLLYIDGNPEFPCTFGVHNHLPHSDELWSTQFSNLHRYFYCFPQYEEKSRISTSQRLLMHHGYLHHDFPEPVIREHLEQFRLHYLNEVVGVLAKQETYTPPSILRTYAPNGTAIDQLVSELTTLYEERLRESDLARDLMERESTFFMDRSNLWISVLVMLFSIAQFVNIKWLQGLFAGMSILLVIFLIWNSFRLQYRSKKLHTTSR